MRQLATAKNNVPTVLLTATIRAGLFGWLILAAVTVVNAQGTAPMVTDDTGTPGSGKWEINFGIGTEKRVGSSQSELPAIDFNYGVGERMQLMYGVPFLRVSEAGSAPNSGVGTSVFGVKWRFFQNDVNGLSASIHPQVQFRTPSAGSDNESLANSSTTFVLPFQFEHSIGAFAIVGQIGREFGTEGDFWLYGISASRRVTRYSEIAIELVGESSASFGRTILAANLGFAIDLNERNSFLFSFGRELHNHYEPRACFVGYLGMQWRL